MPRLVGKKSSPAIYVVFGLLIVAIGAISMEYFGVVNYIPGFGKETTTGSTPSGQVNRVVNKV